MVLSASKSTSNRETSTSSTKPSSSTAKQQSSVDSRKKIPLQRSKSASAVRRSYTKAPAASAAGDLSVAQFLNKRDNPLFCCSSLSSPEREGGDDGCSTRKGRSVSRSLGYGNQTSGSRNQSTRSLSRVGSEGRLRAISREHYDYSESRSWEDGISISSLSDLEETTIREAIRRKNFTLHSSDSFVEMGPELVNQDTLELVSDIRMEYETKLKESHERTRKLRADLAVEEQREEEINRMLKEIIPDENSAPRKSRPRKKLSIERFEMSRRLAEDAMSYFDECVSISTFDSSDFSSAEDQQSSSIGIIPPLDGSRSLTTDVSTYTTPCNLNGRLNQHEEVEIQSKCSVRRAAGSSLAAISCCSSSQDASLPFEDKKHDKLSDLGVLYGGSIEISSASKAANSGECHDFRTYYKKFEKESNKSAKNIEVSSSFNINDYDLDNSAESLLLEIVVFKNRIESGSLLLCDIRML